MSLLSMIRTITFLCGLVFYFFFRFEQFKLINHVKTKGMFLKYQKLISYSYSFNSIKKNDPNPREEEEEEDDYDARDKKHQQGPQVIKIILNFRNFNPLIF